jgi:hypothetical protein
MKAALTLLTILSCLSFASAENSPAMVKAYQLSQQSVVQDGPNCFNTAMYMQGFVDEIVHTSSSESQFYLENFCREKSANEVPSTGDVISFRDSQDLSNEIHETVMLENNQIIEKNSIYGTVKKPFEGDPVPGRYLIHNLQESLYSPIKSKKLFDAVYTQKIFTCQTAEQVQKAMATILQIPAVQEQLQFRHEIAQTLKIADRAALEKNILEVLVPIVEKMSWDQSLDKNGLSQQEAKYLAGILRSNANQLSFLNCTRGLEKYGECYQPSLTASIKVTDAWFTKIFAFEKEFNLSKYYE